MGRHNRHRAVYQLDVDLRDHAGPDVNLLPVVSPVPLMEIDHIRPPSCRSGYSGPGTLGRRDHVATAKNRNQSVLDAGAHHQRGGAGRDRATAQSKIHHRAGGRAQALLGVGTGWPGYL